MSSRLKLNKRRRPREKVGTTGPSPIASAVKLHRGGQIAEAVRLYREILARTPDQVDALQLLAVAQHQLGDPESALMHIDRALALMPNHPDARNNRGNILKQLGRLDEAEADYRHVLALVPDDPNALSNLGTVHRARGHLPSAEALFRKVIALRPDHASAWRNLGNTLKEMDRLDEALDALKEAMRLAPQSPDSYRHLGALLHAVHRTEEAGAVFRQWFARFPSDPRARHFAAACSGGAVPDRASDECVRAEFDDFAPVFDATLARLECRAPSLVDGEVARLFPDAKASLDVLDAGCGTGLCGPLLRPRAKTLVGVDLSPAMIELARKRSLYDDLVVAELTAHLRAHPAGFDAVVSADTLVYFGDLGEVVRAAAGALRPGGALVFTVEAAQLASAPAGFRINPHGRYSHTRDYLLRVLSAAGFADVTVTAAELRKEAGKWVAGFLVSCHVPRAA
jgi:predicted TPR repeat methyltransferase